MCQTRKLLKKIEESQRAPKIEKFNKPLLRENIKQINSKINVMSRLSLIFIFIIKKLKT